MSRIKEEIPRITESSSKDKNALGTKSTISIDDIQSIDDVLKHYRQQEHSSSALGTEFENLIKRYFQTDKLYIRLFKEVYLWNEFEFRKDFGTGRDIGIDLVGVTARGEYHAIQCKFYHQGNSVDKQGVDSFIAISSRSFGKNKELHFTQRFFVSTTNKWSSNAEVTIENQNPPVQVIDLAQLRRSRVDWNKLLQGYYGKAAQKEVYKAKPHQEKAIQETLSYFRTEDHSGGVEDTFNNTENDFIHDVEELNDVSENEENKTFIHKRIHDRGKLIMACGTGKTFTSLRIAENIRSSICHQTDENPDKHPIVLVLVPSISLITQVLKEWNDHSREPMHSLVICSDDSANEAKKLTSVQKDQEDKPQYGENHIGYPPSTDKEEIKKNLRFALDRQKKENGMVVVFSTYQSIAKISEVQKEWNKENHNKNVIFDLTICDEAHRTTGYKLKEEKDNKYFTMVHGEEYIRTHRRLYMTATPRIYRSEDKGKNSDVFLYSMDDREIYGDVIHELTFADAIKDELLSDYKIVVLAITPKEYDVIRLLSENEKERIKENEEYRVCGVANALNKKLVNMDHFYGDPTPMKKIVAFCSRIKDSKSLSNYYNSLSKKCKDTKTYGKKLNDIDSSSFERISAKHIDGTMPTSKRQELLDWLEHGDDNTKENEARILHNVRCLSEGIDVPSLDACVFFSTRSSKVDVVQSVGRVMRQSAGKKFGYIIIPVIVEPNENVEEVMGKKKEWQTVWDVVSALRSHDKRLDGKINTFELEGVMDSIILTAPKNPSKPSVIIDGIDNDEEKETKIPKSSTSKTIEVPSAYIDLTQRLKNEGLPPGLVSAFHGRLVKQFGTKKHWEQWGEDVGKIAQKQIRKIRSLLRTDYDCKNEFKEFHKNLKSCVYSTIKKEDAIKMLGEHLITKPIFDALFKKYSFASNNPISRAMERMLHIIEQKGSVVSSSEMKRFYKDAQLQIGHVKNEKAKQDITRKLYDNFFQKAFKTNAEKHGVVYTPIEVVDFIIQSVNYVLQKHFNKDISDNNISIIDPFAGTGTFIVRLLQSGLFKDDETLKRKYTQDLWANEIMLLSYYIATVNIEMAYHQATSNLDDGIGTNDFLPYRKILLTDTFNMVYKKEYFDQGGLEDNSKRALDQLNTKIKVIMGNPPYSAGQKSENDNAANESHPILERRIKETYIKNSSARNKRSLYDSYFKAYRWSSDRIDEKEGGVIAFVTNGGWLDSNSGSGFRKSIQNEFSSIYVFNLRGDARFSGEQRRKEGANIFGSGSRAPIAITLLVKQPNQLGKANIYYHDIGDYLNREQKLKIISNFKSIKEIPFQLIKTNEDRDWLNQRKEMPKSFISMESKKKFKELGNSIFLTHSLGVNTSRDAWVYNFNKNELATNVNKTIVFFNEEVDRYSQRKKNKQMSPPPPQKTTKKKNKNLLKVLLIETLKKSIGIKNSTIVF